MDGRRLRVTRRGLLLGAAGGALVTLWPGASAQGGAAPKRLLVVMLRGALDGLHLLPPDEAAYAAARGPLAVRDALALDGGFALHPALSGAHALYARKQLLPVVAVAPPYRQRSHFEAQDCLENGTAGPSGARDGWLGRCVDALPGAEAVAVAPVMPLSLRGADAARTWSPPLPQALAPSLASQLEALYAADERLAPVYAAAMRDSPAGGAGNGGGGVFRLPQAMAAAAGLMTAGAGMRVGFVEDSGWDTHRGQAAVLARKLGELDAGLKAARDGFGDAWSGTVVAVVTEFGRTVAVNGTGGTDHGTGGMALLAGGAVRGGRIAGDWPGLAPGQLNDGRDLRATTDLRALFKTLALSHLGVAESAVETRLFPDSRTVRPLDGLLA